MAERAIANYHTFIGHQFIVKLDFSSQYNSIYKARFKTLKERCLSSASDEPGFYFLTEIMEVKPNQSCLVSGVIVRTYKTRQSVIEKYIVKVGTLDAQPASTKITTSAKDQIFLEDESGRVRLDTKQCIDECQSLVTGVVVALRGVMRENSVLEVIQVYYPSVDVPRTISRQGDEFICFVSGLEIGCPNYDIILLHLLTGFLQGNLGLDSAEIARKIVRLVILGNSLYKPNEQKSLDKRAFSDLNSEALPVMTDALKLLDTFLAELAGILPIDVIPGDMDPANSSMPQQALSPYLFPLASRYSALKSFPNPYECKLDGMHMLCTSGQNIEALIQYSGAQNDPIKFLELTMKWGHLAPNAPDALQCIPMQEQDPFILDMLPNLYVVGCMESYAKSVTDQGVHCITVPKFSRGSHQIVLVNRFSLESETISFDALI